MDRKTISRLGGLQTRLRYGKEHMKETGRLGGRPRAKVLSSLPASITKGGMLPGDLRELKRLWRNNQRGVLSQ